MDGFENATKTKPFVDRRHSRAAFRWCAAVTAAIGFALIASVTPSAGQGVDGQGVDGQGIDRIPRLQVVGPASPIETAARTRHTPPEIVRPPARLIRVGPTAPDATIPDQDDTSDHPLPSKHPGFGSVAPAANTNEVDTAAVDWNSNAPKMISIEDALKTRGSVTFRKTPLSEVVFLLSDLWHINIVAGENVSGDVTGSFHDAPLSEVLAAVLTSSGYSYRKTGSSLIVLSADQIGSDDPTFESRMLSLPATRDDQDESIIEAASLLLSSRGQIKKIGQTNVLVIDHPDRIARVESLFVGLGASAPRLAPAGEPSNAPEVRATTDPGMNASPDDSGEQTDAAVFVQSGIAYFTPQYTEAEEMAVALQAALGEDVLVAVYAIENRLMIKGTPEQLRLAGEAIKQLDRPRKQVRITAMIYDVNLTEIERLGINWSRNILTQGADAAGGAVGGAGAVAMPLVSDFFSTTADLTGTGATSIGIRTLTETMDAGLFLEALDANSEAKLLADPSITVGDRREASIRIVRKIPIVGANPVQGSNAVFTQTEFEEAGVILKVRPRISRDGTIEMDVQPEYSVVAELTDTGPVIDSRTAQTIVRVADGQMFVLGGLRQKSIIESQRGIPYLRDIKYVGKLFRAHNTEIRESELIVFLRPEIITPYYGGKPREQKAACVANEQLDRIPYAEMSSQLPCCEDPYCPNHHPRVRINGGSYDLHMMGGLGMGECFRCQNGLTVPETFEIQTVAPEPEFPAATEQPMLPYDAPPQQYPLQLEPVQVHSPVHITPPSR